MSQNAVNIIKKKHKDFSYLDIKAKIYDMTEDKTDQELKQMQIFNDDVADLISI